MKTLLNRVQKKTAPILYGFFAILILGALVTSGCNQNLKDLWDGILNPEKEYDYSKMKFDFYDTNGLENQIVEQPKVGESLSIGFKNLEPNAPVQVFLNDDKGNEWSYARYFADQEGKIDPAVFWFHSGVIGGSSKESNFIPEPSFKTFEEADKYFAQHPLILTIKNLQGKVVGKQKFKLAPNKAPMVYPSNKAGVLYNAFNLQKDEIFATGKNFPKGALVQLYLVPNQHFWNQEDPLMDVTGKNGGALVDKVQLKPNQSSFTAKIADAELMQTGAYDIVARVGNDQKPQLRANDIISYADDTGVVLYIIINGNIVIQSAGRMKSGPAKFEFSDAFEKGEDVYAAVDPTDVPAVHAGGNYAAYYVVDDQNAAYWDGASPALNDVSGGTEIQRVKYWCINATRRMVWNNATQVDPIKGYDLVVDFGSTVANNIADYTADNTYNKGLDFIDGYNDVGFYVYEDPSTTGPYAVGEVELIDQNGISGITDPGGVTGPTYDINLAWAKIMYPANAAGSGVPVSNTLANYPLAVFEHGRHANCDSNGASTGGSGSIQLPGAACPQANRIPSHDGYNYIMQQLASQGIICISISTHDIQHDGSIWNYDVRGRLILKFLDKLKDWNDNGTDPFSGIFNGKINMSEIALSGHSRGGEGVVAAEVLSSTWPINHNIVAVNAIAPTDQHNGTSYVPTDAAYYLIVGARDGDVSNMQGFRTYDRAFPNGVTNREPKMVAWVYGANHNYFNTVWTDAAALGSPNPWASSLDDGGGLIANPVMTAAEQRQMALTTICAFFRQYLQDIEPYKEIFTGRVQPAAMRNDLVYWTYQDGERVAVDNNEQNPINVNSNTIGGAVSTSAGFTTTAEILLNNGSTDYTNAAVLATRDTRFYHDTKATLLSYPAASQSYTSNLTAGNRDVSAFSHLCIRACKVVSGAPGAGPDINIFVNIEDGNGDTAMWDLRSEQFDPLPHPYNRNWPANQLLLTGVRIPLQNFTMNNSGVDLNDIRSITIKTDGAGSVAIDDIEFCN